MDDQMAESWMIDRNQRNGVSVITKWMCRNEKDKEAQFVGAESWMQLFGCRMETIKSAPGADDNVVIVCIRQRVAQTIRRLHC
jgi:hypothetical protein